MRHLKPGAICPTGPDFACWVFDEFKESLRHVEKIHINQSLEEQNLLAGYLIGLCSNLALFLVLNRISANTPHFVSRIV